MTHIFTVEETLAALKEAVAERGAGYIYEYEPLSNGTACSYSTVAGDSSCIVGNALQRLTPDIFKSIHEYEWRTGANGGFDLYEQSIDLEMQTINGKIMIPFEQDAIELLFDVQRSQDNGASWGKALAIGSLAK